MLELNRPLRTQSRAIRTRNHIVESALRVFATKGYRESSMDDVCAAAGCSKGGLYHHFHSKEAVLVEVVSSLNQAGGLGTSIERAAVATGLPEPVLSRLLLDIWAEASRSPELAAVAILGWAAGLDALLSAGAVVSEATTSSGEDERQAA